MVAYQPGCPLDQLTVTKVLAAMDSHGADTLPLAESPSLDKLREITRKFDEILETAPANRKIQDFEPLVPECLESCGDRDLSKAADTANAKGIFMRLKSSKCNKQDTWNLERLSFELI